MRESSDTPERAPPRHILIEGLSRLEYRGYYSAGIAAEQERQVEVAPQGKVNSRSLKSEPSS